MSAFPAFSYHAARLVKGMLVKGQQEVVRKSCRPNEASAAGLPSNEIVKRIYTSTFILIAPKSVKEVAGGSTSMFPY